MLFLSKTWTWNEKKRRFLWMFCLEKQFFFLNWTEVLISSTNSSCSCEFLGWQDFLLKCSSSSLPDRSLIAFLFSPDLFKYRLINSRLINSTFLHNKEGCLLSDVSDENNAYMVYFVSFLGTLAVLPGNIVSALLMDKIGRLRMLGMMGRHLVFCL